MNKKYADFYKYFVSDDVTLSLVKKLLKEDLKEEKRYSVIINFAWMIFSESSAQNFGDEECFVVTPLQLKISEYFYDCSQLAAKKIPFSE